MKKKILVTGGAGYIGSFVVKILLSKGYEVVVLDKLFYGRKGLDSFLKDSGVHFIHGDIRDPKLVDRSLEGIYGVIALAAIVGDPACAINEEVTWDINFYATRLLVNKAIEKGIKRFVFASSCSVYGSSKGIELLTEESDLNPVSIYAETRIKSEEYILSKSDILSSVILRLSTVFGLSPRMRFDLAVNIMTAKAVNTGSLDVYGGGQWRPFVHVQDVASAFVMALEAEDRKARGEIFNVGSTDSNYQIQEIAYLIADELGGGTSINNINTVVDERNYNVVFGKIHKRINFKSSYSVRDGIRELSNFVLSKDPNINDKVYSNYAIWKEYEKLKPLIPSFSSELYQR